MIVCDIKDTYRNLCYTYTVVVESMTILRRLRLKVETDERRFLERFCLRSLRYTS